MFFCKKEGLSKKVETIISNTNNNRKLDFRIIKLSTTPITEEAFINKEALLQEAFLQEAFFGKKII